MFRIVRTDTLRVLRADRDALEALRVELAATKYGAELANDAAIRGADTVERLLQELARANSDAAHAEGRLEVLSAQHLLDTEDRTALRMLLRLVRKQNSRADRVYVLWRHGRLHSLHATSDSAEAAAEAEGAPRSGWTALEPGAPLPPASETEWRVQALPLGGVR